jgi:hypothetical protein
VLRRGEEMRRALCVFGCPRVLYIGRAWRKFPQVGDVGLKELEKDGGRRVRECWAAGQGLAWAGRPAEWAVAPCGARGRALGRWAGVAGALFFFYQKFEIHFEASNKIRKMQIRYRWNRYEKYFNMRLNLEQNYKLYKTKISSLAPGCRPIFPPVRLKLHASHPSGHM